MNTLPSPAFNFWQVEAEIQFSQLHSGPEQDNEYKAKAPRGALRSADESVRRR